MKIVNLTNNLFKKWGGVFVLTLILFVPMLSAQVIPLQGSWSSTTVEATSSQTIPTNPVLYRVVPGCSQL